MAQRKARVAENRSKLKGIIKMVVFLCHTYLPFRGHHESKENVTESDGDGLFHVALRFRVEAGDKTLKTLLADSPSYASYVSPRIPNEL